MEGEESARNVSKWLTREGYDDVIAELDSIERLNEFSFFCFVFFSFLPTFSLCTHTLSLHRIKVVDLQSVGSHVSDAEYKNDPKGITMDEIARLFDRLKELQVKVHSGDKSLRSLYRDFEAYRRLLEVVVRKYREDGDARGLLQHALLKLSVDYARSGKSSSESVVYDWKKIGKDMSKLWRAAIPFEVVNGEQLWKMQKKERSQRKKPTEEQTLPLQQARLEGGELRDQTVSRASEMLKELRAMPGKRTTYRDFIVSKSFAESIERTFNLSVLLREGQVLMKKENDDVMIEIMDSTPSELESDSNRYVWKLDFGFFADERRKSLQLHGLPPDAGLFIPPREPEEEEASRAVPKRRQRRMDSSPSSSSSSNGDDDESEVGKSDTEIRIRVEVESEDSSDLEEEDGSNSNRNSKRRKLGV